MGVRGFRVPGLGFRIEGFGFRETLYSELEPAVDAEEEVLGRIFKAHRLLYHSTLGLRVIKKREEEGWLGGPAPTAGGAGPGFTNLRLVPRRRCWAESALSAISSSITCCTCTCGSGGGGRG